MSFELYSTEFNSEFNSTEFNLNSVSVCIDP